ncbi:MAG: hypothetical protein ABSG23_05070 [Terriglobales bacterium]|jgi:hypothetical protein
MPRSHDAASANTPADLLAADVGFVHFDGAMRTGLVSLAIESVTLWLKRNPS